MNNKRNAKGVDIVGTNLKVPFHFYFDFFKGMKNPTKKFSC